MKGKPNNQLAASLPYLFMLVAALSRWPGLFPPNFSAFYGLAFCAGAFFPRQIKWWLPLGTMLLTDIALNAFYYHETVFSIYMLFKTLGFVAILALGCLFSAKMPWIKLLAGGLLGAVVFYFISNTASWIYNPGYPKTLAGWLQALTSGIPNYPPTWTFFNDTLLSGGLFTGLFAGAMKLTTPESESAQEKETEEEESPEPAPEEAKA